MNERKQRVIIVLRMDTGDHRRHTSPLRPHQKQRHSDHNSIGSIVSYLWDFPGILQGLSKLGILDECLCILRQGLDLVLISWFHSCKLWGNVLPCIPYSWKRKAHQFLIFNSDSMDQTFCEWVVGCIISYLWFIHYHS